MGIFDVAKGILFIFPDGYWQVRRWSQFSPPPWDNPHTEGFGASFGASYLVNLSPGNSIYLVEGIIDSLSFGPYTPVAATLSYNVHKAQLDKLKAKGFRHFVYCPDGDVPYKEIERNMHTLADNTDSWQLKQIPFGDPNDMTEEERKEFIHGNEVDHEGQRVDAGDIELNFELRATFRAESGWGE
jgi:hypothetical protein